MRAVSLASSQSCRSVDADAWWKSGLTCFWRRFSTSSLLATLPRLPVLSRRCREPWRELDVDFNVSSLLLLAFNLEKTYNKGNYTVVYLGKKFVLTTQRPIFLIIAIWGKSPKLFFVIVFIHSKGRRLERSSRMLTFLYQPMLCFQCETEYLLSMTLLNIKFTINRYYMNNILILICYHSKSA